MQKNQNLWESKTDIQLVFQCDGTDVDSNIDEIKAIGRDSWNREALKILGFQRYNNTINIQSLCTIKRTPDGIAQRAGTWPRLWL